MLGAPLAFGLSEIAPALGIIAGSAVLAAGVLGQIWAEVFLRLSVPGPCGALFAGRGAIGVRDQWLRRRASPESVRLTGSPGLVRPWGKLVLTLEGLRLVPNFFSLGSPPIEIGWNEVSFGEVTQVLGRTGLKLSLNDESTVWIETGGSRADDIRRALAAASVRPISDVGI